MAQSITLSALLFLSLSAFASTPSVPPPAFDSALAAVQHAADTYHQASVAADREYIGAIFRFGQDYGYTVARGMPGANTVSVSLRLPEGAELVAFWHTHGAPALERRYFSSTDVALVDQYGVPFYLVDPRGILRVYRPGAPRLSAMVAERRGLPRRPGYAVGERVTDKAGA
ncbi:DUF4329 domain-containing protein [Thalassobaculum salexigens]|uniref:DUF4329 domain-containing protein n=1 Tax=Thalassobaculum salexigens TaxID=455360 RepID=UPI00248F1C8F|nr:DUF4329 domain-containing protein [Thalassobaculum salexigens]